MAKRKPGKLAAAVLDLVAPLLLYEGEVKRVEISAPPGDLERRHEVFKAQRRMIEFHKMTRRQRRATEAALRAGKGEEIAFAIGRARR